MLIYLLDIAHNFIIEKEKDNYALTLKLYAEGLITILGALFKLLDYIEIDTLINNSIFKVLKYNLG